MLHHLEQGLPGSQWGCHERRGSINMIMQDICQEQHFDIYTSSVDLTEAFDSVSREGLWEIVANGYPDKFIALVCSFHDGMQVCVQDEGESSWVTQGCVLTHTLFSIMFSAVLSDAFRDDSDILMENFATYKDSKRNPKFRNVMCEICFLPMTVFSMLGLHGDAAQHG